MSSPVDNNLTNAQNELYRWIKDYMKNFQHSPSIRQMMQAMGLKSPAPIQSRLKHLHEKKRFDFFLRTFLKASP